MKTRRFDSSHGRDAQSKVMLRRKLASLRVSQQRRQARRLAKPVIS